MTSAVHAPSAQVPDADAAQAPAARLQLREFLSVAEFAATQLHRSRLEALPRGDGHAVLVIPGFLTGEFSTRYLRGFLRGRGYYAHDWKGGRNLGPRAGSTKALRARVEELVEASGGPISIIGWSLGGVYAREIGRRMPDQVRQVITMGSPIRGNPAASTPFKLYQRLNPTKTDEDPVRKAARLARAEPLAVPTTCIYSRTDGVVAWQCCTSLPAPQTENVEVHSTHCGFGHNLETLAVLADRLAQPAGQWRPYRKR